ncbi:MAG TPA: cytidine deaminase [Ignavibacteria bacterium]|nr:cytidine deaminase [Ignavibacteria bacterium]
MYEKLISESLKAKKFSHSPYSKFRVGVALLTNKGKIYYGANVECSSYSLTICAERVAAVKAITDKQKKFKAVAISSDSSEFAFPCGACRQFLAEFSDNMDVILVKSKTKYQIYKLQNLFPHKFKLK